MKKNKFQNLYKNYQKLYKLYLEGNSLKKIGLENNVSRHTIARIFKQKKLKIKTSKESHPKTGSTLNDNQKKTIKDLLFKRNTLDKIRKKLKISYGRLHNYLDEEGIVPGYRKVELDEKKIRDDYLINKLTIEEIATKYNCNAKTIRKSLKKFKIKVISAKKRFTINVSNLSKLNKKMRAETDSLSATAKKAGVSRYIFKQRLKDGGFKLRTKSQEQEIVFNKKKKGFKSNYFKRLTKINSYWIGFILTDGSISGKKGKKMRLSINLSVKDINHLKKFKKILSAGTIRTQDMSKYNFVRKDGLEIKGGIMATYSLSSTSICRDLGKYGIVPRKTKKAEPNSRLVFSSDFWRGVIDGDGSISKLKNKKGITNTRLDLGSASKKLINSYEKFLNKYGVKPKVCIRKSDTFNTFYVANLTGERARQIAKILYLKSPKAAHLDRKYLIAKSWFK